jgi:hypothetical protein
VRRSLVVRRRYGKQEESDEDVEKTEEGGR